ncbi:hypothetical protein JXJ21_11185 [candidate division KSB1 bacterium]|nr:hypothetical protein [candidate division KSB1 bacterium]
MKQSHPAVLFVVMSVALVLSGNSSIAQEDVSYVTESFSLNYLTPTELIESLSLQKSPTGVHEFVLRDFVVQLRFNNAINEVVLSGSQNAITETKKIISMFDIPPRQIVIEAKIVEVDNQKMNEIGVDVQNILNSTSVHSILKIGQSETEVKTQGPFTEKRKTTTDNQEKSISTSTSSSLGDFLKLVIECDAGRIVSVPKIVTINNKNATILDGQRITYVSKYSSYSNLFESQELTAGLFLSVTPSLGKSGYLKLDVTAKLTQLGEVIGGSPSESGQMLTNTVIAKDNETFLLGGFKKTETRKIRKRTPILGYVLPFLFSKHIDREITKDILILLTPKIIDLKPEAVPDI